MEIDGAYFYKEKEILTLIPKDDKHFFVSQTIEVISKGKTINTIGDNSLMAMENTVLLMEDILKIPGTIDNFDKNKNYEKSKLFSSLIFTVYKLIKKIKFYKEFISSELDYKDKISFTLVLIYNKKPIEDLENEVKNCISTLFMQNLIEQEKFNIKLIYILPNISLNNNNNLVGKLAKNVQFLTKQVLRLNKLLVKNGNDPYEDIEWNIVNLIIISDILLIQIYLKIKFPKSITLL